MKLKKAFFYIQKSFISPIVFMNSRLYMKLYNKLLKKQGCVINGVPRFIAKSARFDDFKRITLGDRLVVSMNVHFLTHDYSYTTALASIGEKPTTDIGVLKNIIIGNNVFIGMNAILLPGTNIGNNVIVGAGCVVRGKIPDNSVIVGNPAVVVSNIHDYANKLKTKGNFDLIIDDN